MNEPIGMDVCVVSRLESFFMKEDISANIFRKFFLVLGIITFFTPFLLGIPRISNSVMSLIMYGLTPRYLFIYVVYSTPFIVLSFMFIKWGMLKSGFVIRDSLCRLIGAIVTYLGYVYMARNIVQDVTLGLEPSLGIIYVVSMPVVMPALYFMGYLLSRVIFEKKSLYSKAEIGQSKKEKND